MPDMNEKELIEALRAGGAARELATEQLLNRNIFYVQKLAKKFRLAEDAVLDAYTDGLLLTIDHIISGRFEQKSKVSTYLYQVVYNKCRDLSKKSATKEVAWEEWLQDWEPSSQRLLKDLEVKEEVDRLHRYLEEMGEPCRKILLDWGYWGYRMDEIAKRSGLENATQAKRKKYKCLQRLLKKMPQHGR